MGLNIKIKTDKIDYNTGEVILSIDFENCGNSDEYVPKKIIDPEICRIQIDQFPNGMARNDYFLKPDKTAIFTPNTELFKSLKPGESSRIYSNLNQAYGITQPGKYHVQCIYNAKKFAKGMNFNTTYGESNKIWIEIQKALPLPYWVKELQSKPSIIEKLLYPLWAFIDWVSEKFRL